MVEKMRGQKDNFVMIPIEDVFDTSGVVDLVWRKVVTNVVNYVQRV